MAFVTYVLLAAFVLGTRNEYDRLLLHPSFCHDVVAHWLVVRMVRFTPEMLGKLASSGLISLGFEVVFLKFGFYLLNSMNCSVFDLLSYAGYIFIRYTTSPLFFSLPRLDFREPNTARHSVVAVSASTTSLGSSWAPMPTTARWSSRAFSSPSSWCVERDPSTTTT